MLNIFKKKEKVPSAGEAVQKLRETEEMLQKKSDYLEKKIEEEIKIAKKNGTKNKRVAIAALKRKKRLDKQLQQIDGTLSTIEFQREALENANTNTEVLKTMAIAAKAMKNANKNMDVDEVHNTMDDIAEQQEIADEISQAISQPAGFQQDIDEDDLLAELEELEQEELDEQLLNVGDTGLADLPSVPTGEPAAARPSKAKVADDDDDMRELEAWAS